MKKWLITAFVVVGVAAQAGLKEDMAAARALYDSQDYVGAQAAFEQILLANQNAPERALGFAKLWRAKSLEAQGENNKAAAGYKQILVDHSTVPGRLLSEAAQNLGRVYTHQDKPAKAAQAYTDGFTNPNVSAKGRAQSGMALATLLKNQKDYEGALAALNSSLEALGDDLTEHPRAKARLWSDAGTVNFLKGDLDAAGDAYLKVPLYGDTPELRKIAEKYGLRMPEADYLEFLSMTARAVMEGPDTDEFLGNISSKLITLRAINAECD